MATKTATPTASADVELTFMTVPVWDIGFSPDQTRLFPDDDTEGQESLDELAASIKALGLQQPPKVRPAAGGGENGVPLYVLVYGERRLRAVRDVLKLETIRVIVDQSLGDVDAAEATVIENMQRRDLHPMEQARGLLVLRRHGKTVPQIAKRLGRTKEWITERLKLTELPPVVQDIYLADKSGNLTYGRMQELHTYTVGGPENKGFAPLIEALATDAAAGRNVGLYLSIVDGTHPALVKQVPTPSWDQGGRYGGNYFDASEVCAKHCPFNAFVPGNSWGGYCLVPDHYAKLQAKGQEAYEAARAAQAAAGNALTPSGYQSQPEKTAGQKGKETRARRLKQKADYPGNVGAVRRAVDMISNVESADLAVLAAYTMAHVSLSQEEWSQIGARHDVDPDLLRKGASDMSRPGELGIGGLRKLPELGLVKATIEALLLMQAKAARDYEPEKSGPAPVFKMYLGAMAAAVPDDADVAAIAAAIPDDEDDSAEAEEDADGSDLAVSFGLGILGYPTDRSIWTVAMWEAADEEVEGARLVLRAHVHIDRRTNLLTLTCAFNTCPHQMRLVPRYPEDISEGYEREQDEIALAALEAGWRYVDAWGEVRCPEHALVAAALASAEADLIHPSVYDDDKRGDANEERVRGKQHVEDGSASNTPDAIMAGESIQPDLDDADDAEAVDPGPRTIEVDVSNPAPGRALG